MVRMKGKEMSEKGFWKLFVCTAMQNADHLVPVSLQGQDKIEENRFLQSSTSGSGKYVRI